MFIFQKKKVLTIILLENVNVNKSGRYKRTKVTVNIIHTVSMCCAINKKLMNQIIFHASLRNLCKQLIRARHNLN